MDIEKFTERARGFLQAAQTIAIREFHQRITPEHLLKALLDDEEGAAAGLIRTAGGDPKAAAAGVRGRTRPAAEGAGRRRRPAADHAGTGARAGRRAAGRDQGGRRVCRAGPAAGGAGRVRTRRPARALKAAGVTPQALEKAVTDIRKGRKVDQPNAEANFDALKKYARDVTALAREGKLDPVIGRDEEIRRTIQVLARRTKNNPVLIGEPGVGKTAIVEGLAHPHRQRRRAGGAEEQEAAVARPGRDGRRFEIPRRVRGTAEGRAEGDRRRARARSCCSSTRCTR